MDSPRVELYHRRIQRKAVHEERDSVRHTMVARQAKSRLSSMEEREVDVFASPVHEERDNVRHTMMDPRQYEDIATVTQTQTVAATAAAASATSMVTSGLPSSTAAFIGVGAFAGSALILTALYCFCRRRKVSNKPSSTRRQAPSASFDQNAMFEKKNPFAAEYPLHVDLSPKIVLSPVTPSSASSTEKSGLHSAGSSTLRVKNGDNPSLLPALPKAVAEKRRASQRGKSTWDNAEVYVGSPPPSYDIANSSAQGFNIPIIPAEKIPTKEYTLEHKPSRKGKAANLASLIVPAHGEPQPVASPARSESFAPKDLVLQTPPPAMSPPSSSSSHSSADVRSPRMMTVVAPYTPTMSDELRVRVGDTVRLMLEYKDGWGFVQHVGKVDAPKGVVPLVCLQERKRMVPTVSHKTSTGSVGSNGSKSLFPMVGVEA